MAPPENYQEEDSALLAQGEVNSCRSLPWGSNYAFLMTVADGTRELAAVYKPKLGEAPLWDFPEGTLYLREYAAYVVSRALGWPSIPATVIREGPQGVGSVQLFILPQPQVDFFQLKIQQASEFQRIAAFDVLVNNADRKAGHCLPGRDGRLWAIDHGLTFHQEPKLRTVLWDWSGQPLPPVLVSDMERARPLLDGYLGQALEGLLLKQEIAALARRWDALLEKPVFPLRGPYRSVPWPPF